MRLLFIKYKFLIASIFLLFVFLLFVNIAKADYFFPEATDFCSYVKAIFDFAMIAAAIIVLVLIAIAGVYYITSLGQTEKIKKAKSIITGGISGLLLVLLSWTLFQILNPYLLKCKIAIEAPAIVPTENICAGLTTYTSQTECEGAEADCAPDGTRCVQGQEACKGDGEELGEGETCCSGQTKTKDSKTVCDGGERQEEQWCCSVCTIGINCRDTKVNCLAKEYGCSEEEVKKHLVPVEFPGMTLEVHEKVKSNFEAAAEAWKNSRPDYQLKNGSYTFSWRAMVNNPECQSYHSFGIAIDVNPSKNPLCPDYPQCEGETKLITDIPEEVQNAFKNNGFSWGGDWTSKKDPMHFEIKVGPCF